VSVRRREIALAGTLALVFGAAPTVGDVGSCGRVATALDPLVFANQRKSIDCHACAVCGLKTAVCQRACDPNAAPDVAWPDTCHPLDHDGEVCLRALDASSCGDYAAFVSDVSRTVPSECDFCHLVAPLGEGGP
jgi:hypothetical protein